MNSVKRNSFSSIVRILTQPMANNEVALIQIENRVLRELAIGADATKIIVWEEEALSDEAVLKKFQEL